LAAAPRQGFASQRAVHVRSPGSLIRPRVPGRERVQYVVFDQRTSETRAIAAWPRCLASQTTPLSGSADTPPPSVGMNSDDHGADSIESPDVSNWLLAFLSVRREEYEAQYGPGETEEGRGLDEALAALERRALALVSTGIIPGELGQQLRRFRPGDPVSVKLKELLTLRIVHHRLEFDVAEDVCERLSGLDERVWLVALLTAFLLGRRAPDTAVKYFERATKLYLAGYDSEAVVMCGAVLDAAFAARFPDEVLRNAGLTPAFRRTGVYALGQRVGFEEAHPVLTDSQRTVARQLIQWRNDAVHVQPDIGPSPDRALVSLAVVLPGLVPSTTG
jgi:hypothetical protein